jgi:hypothetical protein
VVLAPTGGWDLVQGEGSRVMPPETPATALRNLLQHMLVVLDLYETNGQAAVPMAMIDTWIVRVRQIVAQLEA